MRDKLILMLGLARKAGKVSLGYDAMKLSLSKGKSKLIVVASDVSDNSLRKISNCCMPYGIRIINIRQPMSELEHMFNKKIGVVSVNDINFAQKIIETAELEETVYDD